MKYTIKIRSITIIIIFALSLLSIIQIPLPAFAATSTATQTYVVNSPQYFFNGKAQPNVTTTYRFKPTGTVNWFNSQGGNVSLSSTAPSTIINFNSTAFWYTFSGTIQGAIITATIYFIKQISIINHKSYPSPDFKIKLVGTTSAQISFSFNLNNIKNAIVDTNNPCAVQLGSLGFNWCDVTNINITFNPVTLQVTMIIPAGLFKIDPTTIGTTTINSATYFIPQRKTFFCQTRYWAFYSDGTNMVWRTSTDATTWSSTTTVRSSNSGKWFSVWDDCGNTKIYYAWANGGGSFLHRAGTLNTDGTITWDYNEVAITASEPSAYANIIRSTDSKLYATFEGVITSGGSAGDYVEVFVCTISGTNCGTAGNWASSLNYMVSTATSFQVITPVISPLTSGKLSLVYAKTNAVAKLGIRTFTGTTWNSETLTTASYIAFHFAALAISDTTHFAGLKSGNNVLYWNCAYPCSSAPTEITISSGTGNQEAGISSDNSNEILVVYGLFGNTGSLLYKTSGNSGTTFGTEQTLVNPESISSDATLTVTYTKQNNFYELLWTSNSGFNVRFALITTNVPQIIQSKSCTYTGSSGTCAFNSNTLAQSSIVVFVGATVTTTVSTVTDTQLLTYSQIISSDVGTVGDNEAWWACHPSTAAADTITVTQSVSVTATIILYELHGRPTGTSCSPSSSSGSSASASSASVTSYTPTRNSLTIGALNSNCEVSCTITAGTSYVLDKNVAINAVNMFATEYIQNFQTAETTPYTFSLSSAYNEVSVSFYDLIWTNTTQSDTTILTESILRTSIPKISDSFSIAESILRTAIPIITDSFTLAESILRISIPLVQDTFNIVITIPLLPSPPVVIPLPSIPQEDNSIIWILLFVLLGTIFSGALIRRIAINNRFEKQ